MARHVFRKVHIGYLVAIVAASNAGGAGSVLGDTTTTMMWIDGVSPLSVLDAYIAAAIAFLVFGVPAAIQQQRFCPILEKPPRGLRVEWTRVLIVAAILFVALLANVVANLKFPTLLEAVPIIGLAVWTVIFATAFVRRPDWEVMPETLKGTIFLLALVTSASMMPVEKLPAAEWQTAFGLGFMSAVFDNIPLTAPRPKTGRLRLGRSGLCGRLRRIDDLVRLFGGRRLGQYVSRSEVGRSLASPRVVRRRRLRYRVLRDVIRSRLASRPGPPPRCVEIISA